MPMTTAMRNYIATKVTAGTGPDFNNATARIGVGNGTTAFAVGQTDLSGASKTRMGMDAGYPQVSGSQMVFRSTFGESEGNHAWSEWGIFNAATGGTMMVREVDSNGVKESPEVKVLTLTITLGA